jgi:Flp pilus assembly protein TadD
MEAAFLFGLDRRGEATQRLRRVLEIEPNFWVAHMTQAMFHLADGAPAAALEALRRADALADGSTQPAALLGVQLGRLGRRDEALILLQRLSDMQGRRYVPPTSLAAIRAALGDVDAALDELERGFAVRDVRLVYMKDDPRWAPLRGQARFAALLRKMKLDALGPGVGGP